MAAIRTISSLSPESTGVDGTAPVATGASSQSAWL
jgi:hypothetical protein